MAMAKSEAKQVGEFEFVISRVFDAPRDLVWKAWTEPDRLLKWWGPRGFDILSTKVDLRVGGIFLYHLRSPQGLEIWGKFVYREISPPKKLVYINSFSDPAGGTTRAPFFDGKWPLANPEHGHTCRRRQEDQSYHQLASLFRNRH